MIWLIVIVFVFLLAMFPKFRCAVCHPCLTAYYAFRDVVTYIRHKQYNLYYTGELVAYVGLFGRGKTLSAVHRVVDAYNRYDGKMVWCPRRKKLVTQRIKVISNVSLSIPYEKFEKLEQLVLDCRRKEAYDNEHDTLTITLVLGDEFSVQLNSRSFKTNIDPLFLNTLLTCRHYYISLYYTAQRFGQVDALLRQVTSAVIDCDKLWRFQGQNFYDAWEMENATNPSLIKPYRRTAWFVRNRDYNAYNTLACVGNLQKKMEEGDMLTEEQILALQCNNGANMDAVAKPSSRWKRQHVPKK